MTTEGNDDGNKVQGIVLLTDEARQYLTRVKKSRIRSTAENSQSGRSTSAKTRRKRKDTATPPSKAR